MATHSGIHNTLAYIYTHVHTHTHKRPHAHPFLLQRVKRRGNILQQHQKFLTAQKSATSGAQFSFFLNTLYRDGQGGYYFILYFSCYSELRNPYLYLIYAIFVTIKYLRLSEFRIEVTDYNISIIAVKTI